MTIKEAIHCLRSYLPDENPERAECKDCKYYQMNACKSNEAHKIAINILLEYQCPHYVDSHSCYWCVFKNTENCPKQEQSEVTK